jgi:hypothetical protein
VQFGRSVWPSVDDPQHLWGGHWVNSSVSPGWSWKRDASSDEVVGHMLAYPLMYSLVARTADEKARVLRLYVDMIDHIIGGGYVLIDITGRRTFWGVW